MHIKKIYKDSLERVFLVLNGNIFLAFTFYFGRKKGGTICECSSRSRFLHITLKNVYSFQKDFTIRGHQLLGHLQQAVVIASQNPWCEKCKLWGSFDPDSNTEVSIMT